jgi:hypothetical protein
MNWSFGTTLPSLVIGGIIWIASAWICWSNWRRSGGRKTVARLESLRFILITLLTFTLLRPEVVQQIQRKDKPQVAVLLDSSGSMETRDVQSGGTFSSRAQWVQQQLNRQFWKPLEREAKVALEEFATQPKGTNIATQPIGTDLNSAMENAFSRAQNLKAVLLVTDGDWNMGKSPVGAATRFREQNIPVFAVAVGRDTPLPDLAIENISPPSYGLFGEQITIPFSIRSHLSQEIKTTVSLLDGAREESKKEVTIPANGELRDTILWFPRNVGDSTLTLKVPVQTNEMLLDNNQRQFRVNVRVDKLKVLVVDSTPRWEYRYLRNALARDPGVEMHSILYHPGMGPGGGKSYLNQFPSTKEAIAEYDVIFLGDVGIGENELTEKDADLIRGLVEQQASGLIFLPGTRGRELTFLKSPLKDLLPVLFDETKPQGLALQNESTLTLTAFGKGHLLTRFEADENLNSQLWANLPGFFWSAAVEKSRPGSEVLAVHSALRNESGRLPLLVTRSAGYGKVLFMGTDSAWRWRRGVEDKYHYRFWSQVVRWMAHQRHLSEKEGIRLAYSPENPQLRDSLYLQATILNSAGFPLEEGPVDGTITSPSGRTESIQFAQVDGGWGVFKSSFTPHEPGKYKISLEAPKVNRKLDTTILVQQPILEKEGQPVNRAVLEEIASITGGATATPEKFDDLLAKIALTPQPKPLEARVRLWSNPYWGGLLLLMLTIYWIGRKLAGML